MTFSNVGKVFHPIRNQLSKYISQFAMCSRLRASSVFIHRRFQSFQKFTLVFSRIHGQRGKFKQVYRFCPLKISSRNSGTKTLEQSPTGRYLAGEYFKFNQQMARITPGKPSSLWRFSLSVNQFLKEGSYLVSIQSTTKNLIKQRNDWNLCHSLRIGFRRSDKVFARHNLNKLIVLLNEKANKFYQNDGG